MRRWLRVSEDGEGIGAEKLPRVFERFWQDGASAHRSGLGWRLHNAAHYAAPRRSADGQSPRPGRESMRSLCGFRSTTNAEGGRASPWQARHKGYVAYPHDNRLCEALFAGSLPAKDSRTMNPQVPMSASGQERTTAAAPTRAILDG